MQAGRKAQAVDGLGARDETGGEAPRDQFEPAGHDWNPTATSDPEALRSVFDTNGGTCATRMA
jgi:hypothetical protein